MEDRKQSDVDAATVASAPSLEKPQSEEWRVREMCARIAGAECAYWAAVDSDRRDVDMMSIGAMGAAANICAAILMGRSPEQHEAEIRARDGQVLPAGDAAAATAAANPEDLKG
jgi:hypothetical protein